MRHLIATLFLLVVLLVAGDELFATTSSLSTIELPKAVHFLSPDGNDVLVQPGTYELEASQEGLRFTPKGGKDSDAVVVQAATILHTEAILSPRVEARSPAADEYRVTLLQPEGEGLEAIGSFSGVRSRGICPTCAAFNSGALASNTTGAANTAGGFQALPRNTIGSDNTAVGASALFANTAGSHNTALGANSLNQNDHSYNTAIGSNALNQNSRGMRNTATGAGALRSNTTGDQNTATGYNALARNTIANGNTAMGYNALGQNTIGTGNTAMGYTALGQNTTGIGNTAHGEYALRSNVTGLENTATGAGALAANTGGVQNTATGHRALNMNSGSGNTATGASSLAANVGGAYNTAVGGRTLEKNTGGHSNTAVGYFALIGNTTGTNNTALGASAGANQSTGSHNIYINNQGATGESGTIRIGAAPNQTRTFVAGIVGVPVSGIPVVVTPEGQLGIAASSIRYKEDIRELGEESAALHQLRPVSFRYMSETVPGASGRPRDYGLLAEEVAEVLSDLVTYGEDGQVQTVRYDQLVPLLLNEVQRLHARMNAQAAQLVQLQAQIAAQQAHQADRR